MGANCNAKNVIGGIWDAIKLDKVLARGIYQKRSPIYWCQIPYQGKLFDRKAVSPSQFSGGYLWDQ